MNRKITALLTAAIFALTPVCSLASDYYPDVEFPQIDTVDFAVEPIDTEIYKRAEAEIRNSMKYGGNRLSEALTMLDIIAAHAQSSYALAYINASRNNTEENNKTVSDIYSVISEISEGMSSLIKDLYDNPSSRAVVTEWIGGEEAMQDFLDSYPSERFYELNEQENQLLNQYRNSPFGSYVYTGDDGNTYTLTELDAKITEILNSMNAEIENEDFDYAAAYAEYEKFSGYAMDYFDKSGEQLGELFSSLVKVRAEIAKESNFESYADYAHTIIYGRDYSSQDIAVLRENVKTHIVPIALKLESVIAELDEEAIAHEDIIPTVRKYIGEINPELSNSFNYMADMGLVDMEYSPGKSLPGIAYTMDIPSLGVPFVFISPVEGNTTWTFETLVHEYGHFNANLYKGLSVTEENAVVSVPNIDISEIHSQGLELLFTDYYDEIYGSDSTVMYFNRLYSLLNSVIDGCMYDEWQERVYAEPDMTLEEMNELYISLGQSYGKDYLYDHDWTQIPHNFEEPMYYISYAVSALAALDIWSQSLTDRPGAIDRYMKTTAYNSDKGFAESLNELGYSDIFSPSTISNITDSISDFASIGYNDISIDDWYWQAVVKTDGYIDDSVNNGGFRPQESILRSEMANSIGMLHEYLGNDIPEGTTMFTDDDDSKYIAWAADNGIIKGYNDFIFGSSDTLTREQAAAILYRYAGEDKQLNPSSLNGFKDYMEVSDWAQDAVLWAVDEGIIRGINVDDYTSIINPQASITRAEAAQMMARFVYYIKAVNLSEGF